MTTEPNNQVIIYEDTNGEVRLDVSLENETVWLSQKQMALLFDVNVSAISKHIKNILADGELDSSTISKMETVQKEGELEKDSVVWNFRTTASNCKNYDIQSALLNVPKNDPIKNAKVRNNG